MLPLLSVSKTNKLFKKLPQKYMSLHRCKSDCEEIWGGGGWVGVVLKCPYVFLHLLV